VQPRPDHPAAGPPAPGAEEAVSPPSWPTGPPTAWPGAAAPPPSWPGAPTPSPPGPTGWSAGAPGEPTPPPGGPPSGPAGWSDPSSSGAPQPGPAPWERRATDPGPQSGSRAGAVAVLAGLAAALAPLLRWFHVDIEMAGVEAGTYTNGWGSVGMELPDGVAEPPGMTPSWADWVLAGIPDGAVATVLGVVVVLVGARLALGLGSGRRTPTAGALTGAGVLGLALVAASWATAQRQVAREEDLLATFSGRPEGAFDDLLTLSGGPGFLLCAAAFAGVTLAGLAALWSATGPRLPAGATASPLDPAAPSADPWASTPLPGRPTPSTPTPAPTPSAVAPSPSGAMSSGAEPSGAVPSGPVPSVPADRPLAVPPAVADQLGGPPAPPTGWR
jgi:hypothetical protein